MGAERLFGIHPVVAALEGQQRQIARVWLDSNRRGDMAQRIAGLAGRRGVPVEMVDRSQLSRLVGHDRHQGVVALVTPLGYQPLASVMARLATSQTPQTMLLLDGVVDVGNFAALIRSAVAFGVKGIILPRHRSVPLTPAVAKHSVGAIERIALVQVVNVVQTLVDLKRQGFWVYGATAQAETPVAQMRWPERVVLVLGGESRGIRRLVRERCDGLVCIPMQAGVDSLNVAVAGAIILAYIWSGREAASPGRQGGSPGAPESGSG